MKKLIMVGIVFCLSCASGISAKVLVVVENDYYTSNQAYVDQYISDVTKIDFKKVDLQLYSRCFECGTTQEICYPLWTIIRNEYQNSYDPSNPDNCLEGVVLVGDLPVAWRADTQLWSWEEDVPDDRYFMDICNNVTHVCYASDADVWDFDAVRNLFTNYRYGSGDSHVDIWVSRIMADEIRGLRDGLNVMDEYIIINNYFTRLHERMTQPAKVPPRAFVMGGISEWSDHDPITKFGFTNLNLNQVFKFDFPDSRPANWLLQLVWGPRGGTTLGAFNGTRYSDVAGQNHIEMTCQQLWDYKGSTSITIPSWDTLGYEWAALYEHSLFSHHSFNQSPDDQDDQTPFGIFTDATLAEQWDPSNLNVSGAAYYNNSAYLYNPDNNASNPWGAICGRGERSIFKALIPTGAGGTYRIYINYPSNPNNSNWVYGYVHSWARDYSFSPYTGHTRVFGLLDRDSVEGWHLGLSKIDAIDMTVHNPVYTYPGTNFECIHDLSGNLADFSFNDNDTAWIEPQADAGNLIADAVMLVPTGGGSPIIIDNSDPGFASNNWYDRAFLDMQDEDMVNHHSISKVPFIVSSGCDVGDYMGCYDPADWYHEIFQTSPHIENDLGLLYGMAHSGLISLTSAISYPGGSVNLFSPFTSELAGKDCHGQPNTFGDGLIAQYNTTVPSYSTNDFNIPLVLIGAGTLRADCNAYVPYGTHMTSLIDMQITGTYSHSFPDTLIWMQNSSVTSTGNCALSGKEIRIYAESDLQGAVDILAQ